MMMMAKNFRWGSQLWDESTSWGGALQFAVVECVVINRKNNLRICTHRTIYGSIIRLDSWELTEMLYS